MTSRRELLALKEQELADLNRIVEILVEIEELGAKRSVDEIIEVSPQMTSLLSEVDRLVRKHKDVLPTDIMELGKDFHKAFSLYMEIYKVEVSLKNDVNRLIRLEMRRRARVERENAAQSKQITLCDVCKKKPARIYANGQAYCKSDARAAGIILKGKIV
jgi:hypothetical protein